MCRSPPKMGPLVACLWLRSKEVPMCVLTWLKPNLWCLAKQQQVRDSARRSMEWLIRRLRMTPKFGGPTVFFNVFFTKVHRWLMMMINVCVWKLHKYSKHFAHTAVSTFQVIASGWWVTSGLPLPPWAMRFWPWRRRSKVSPVLWFHGGDLMEDTWHVRSRGIWNEQEAKLCCYKKDIKKH